MTAGRPIVIGLAGAIGAGKSAVAAELQKLGCVVVDSDREAHAALDRPDVLAELAAWWGPGVVGADGRADRRAIGRIVFADEQERRRLEALVHPLVKKRRVDLVTAARAAGAPAVVVDAPLLFEAGVDAECDAVVFVDAPREQRLARVLAARAWDEAELSRRERAQWPAEDKRRRSGYVLMNDAGRAELARRVAAIFAEVRRNLGKGTSVV